MRRIIFSIVLFFIASNAIAQAKTSSVINAANRADWFKEAKFGMFVHWGLYSILGGTYNGHTLPDTTFKNGDSWYAEWIQLRLEVPENEYRKLVEQFNPVNFDADKWILAAKNAGMKYFVITAKHHDGFALWDSEVSTYDIGSTPFRRDILGELATACRKYGLKFGLYYSHWLDWEHPGGDWPGWSPKQRTDAEFEGYWRQKALSQVAELIKRYDPDLFWFDTWGAPNKITTKRRDELIALIRKMSKKCLINGRICYQDPGNDIDFLEMNDNQYPDKILERPWQTPATMVNSWGWHAKDYNWKPVSEMMGNLISNAAKGGNYLLNVGPKPDGTIPAAAISRLRGMGGWLVANGESVYGTQPVKIDVPKEVALTQRTMKTGEQIIYVSILKSLQNNELLLPLAASSIRSCTILESQRPVEFTKVGDAIKLKLTANIFPSNGIEVIKVEMKK